jgi:hypothetical protein
MYSVNATEVFSIPQFYMDSDVVPNIHQFTPLKQFPYSKKGNTNKRAYIPKDDRQLRSKIHDHIRHSN